MFYESLGLLLEEAARVLGGSVREQVGDERVLTQLDGVAALVADVGAMWPDLFAGLAEETLALEAAAGASSDPAAGPFERYQAAIRAVNERIAELHADGAERDDAAIDELRAALLAAADVQRRVLEPTERAAPDGAGLRRV
jgi:hypothetical protein